MTNATEVNPVQTARDNLAKLETAATEAQSKLTEVEARFLEMVKTGGAGMEPSAQLALADERTSASNAASEAQKLVDGQKSRLDALLKTERLGALEKPVNTVREAARRAFETAGLAKLMAEADAGDYLHVHMHVVRSTDESGAETVKLEVSSAFQTATKTAKPASESTGARGRGTAKHVVADGKSYSAKEYVEAFWDAGIAAGYKTSRASFADVPVNEYSKIAPRIAELLSHSYEDKPSENGAVAPASAPESQPEETPASA